VSEPQAFQCEVIRVVETVDKNIRLVSASRDAGAPAQGTIHRHLSPAKRIFSLFRRGLLVLVLYGIPFLREIPVWGHKRLGDVGVKQKLYTASYLLGLSFFIPLGILTISK
jgi:hypothetical protein